MESNGKKTALVLSGGSIRGAFQAGAINRILQSGIKPRAIYGISVGSLNGGFLADRAGKAALDKREPNWPEIGDELGRFWLENITSFEKIGKKRNKLRLLISLIRSSFDGLIDTKNLRELVVRSLDEDHLRACPITFKAGCVDIESGRLITADSQSYYPDLRKYIIASTAIPIVMPVSWIQDRPFLDGGLRDVAPLKVAIDGGAEEIFCLLCQEKTIKESRLNLGNLAEYAERMMDIVINETLNNDIERAEKINARLRAECDRAVEEAAGHKYIPIKVIRPSASLNIELTDFNRADIERIYKLGQKEAAEKLKE